MKFHRYGNNEIVQYVIGYYSFLEFTKSVFDNSKYHKLQQRSRVVHRRLFKSLWFFVRKRILYRTYISLMQGKVKLASHYVRLDKKHHQRMIL